MQIAELIRNEIGTAEVDRGDRSKDAVVVDEDESHPGHLKGIESMHRVFPTWRDKVYRMTSRSTIYAQEI
jgi:hypothetical protein